jgi:XTP/dITP diphosphohydrolase
MGKRLEIIIGTRNRGKVREIRKALRGLGFRIGSLADFARVPAVREDGITFSENALKKARVYSRFSGKVTVADDSGLEVNALSGMPGIFSARYAGLKSSDSKNNEKLLRELEGVPPARRGARFVCSIAVVSPDGRESVVEGACRGRIGFKPVGRRGFGYDPLFVLPGKGRTMAQLTVEEKNSLSHRGIALKKLRKVLAGFVDHPSRTRRSE